MPSIAVGRRHKGLRFGSIMALAALVSSAFLCSSAPATAQEFKAPINIPAAASTDAVWAVRVPERDPVAFFGMANFDNAGGGPGTMLYPAPNAIGFLVAVLAHAAVADSARTSERQRIQNEADKVLAPYLSVIRDLKHRDVLDTALRWVEVKGTKQVLASGEAESGKWLVDVLPVFALTQDQSAVILDNVITVRSPQEPRQVVYQNTVRVAMTPRDHASSADEWLADQGALIRTAASALIAESLNLAYRDHQANVSNKESASRTVRYREGNAVRIERATVLAEACGRIMLRTLRGWLKSVPAVAASTEPGTEDCGKSPMGAVASQVTSLPKQQ
jgi:hypothetical protein